MVVDTFRLSALFNCLLLWKYIFKYLLVLYIFMKYISSMFLAFIRIFAVLTTYKILQITYKFTSINLYIYLFICNCQLPYLTSYEWQSPRLHFSFLVDIPQTDTFINILFWVIYFHLNVMSSIVLIDFSSCFCYITYISIYRQFILSFSHKLRT